MDNSIAQSFDPIVQLLSNAISGAHDLGDLINLKQNDEAALQTEYDALVGKPANDPAPAEPGLKDKWNLAKAAKVTATGTLQTAEGKGRAQAQSCLSVLKPLLGSLWNNKWINAGFSTGSLEVPSNPLTLLQQLRTYFALNPTHETTNVATRVNATAAACQQAADNIVDAAKVSNESNTAAGTAKKNLQDGIKSARGRLTGLRGELDQLLSAEDERWYSFGFGRPADPTTPAVVRHVVFTAAGPGSFFTDFDDAKNADSYRVRVLDTGVTPPKEIAQKIVDESEATFTGIPSGTHVQIIVTARNDSGGESGPSQPATGIVP